MSLVSAVITAPPSAKVLIEGKGAYSGPLTVNAVFSTTGTPPALPLAFSISPGAAKSLIESEPPVLQGTGARRFRGRTR
jgi:hypothetical protein